MPSPHIVDVTEASFEAEVIERSFKTPVIVDLWAAWCGPCKTLTPVLEQLAEDGGGQWVLARIDVDAAPGLAAQFQAQSIPMVVAVYEGALVHQFAGAMPKAEVERWLDAIFKALGLTLSPRVAEVPPPTDPDEAIPYWRERLAKSKEDNRARLELGRLLLAQDAADEAKALLDAIPGSAPEFGAAQAALALRGFVQELDEAGGEAAVRAQLEATPEPEPGLRYLKGLIDGTGGRFAEALEVLVGLVGTEPDPLREKARKACGLILEAAGRGDPAVEAQRKRLTRLLF